MCRRTKHPAGPPTTILKSLMHACMYMEKVVQTTLPESTYTRLSARAKKDGKPLKAVVQDAIEAYLKEPWPKWEDDPLFKMIGSMETTHGMLSDKHWRASRKRQR